jgi:hypothetical protein
MKEKLKAAQLLVLDTPFAREQEVQSGRADVFLTDYPYSQRFLASTDWARLVSPPSTYHITPYAYAMQPGDDAWAARIERFVSDIKRDGRLLAAAGGTNSRPSSPHDAARLAAVTHDVSAFPGCIRGRHGGHQRLHPVATAWRCGGQRSGIAAMHSRGFEDFLTQSLHVTELVAANSLAQVRLPRATARDRADLRGGPAACRRSCARCPCWMTGADRRQFQSGQPRREPWRRGTYLPADAGRLQILRIGEPWAGVTSPVASHRRRERRSLPTRSASFPVTRSIGLGKGRVTLLFALNPDYFINHIACRSSLPRKDRSACCATTARC